MKTVIFFVLTVWCYNAFSQENIKGKRVKKSNTTVRSSQKINHTNLPVTPRETITEKRLKGNNRGDIKSSKDSSPFVSGIYAAPGAEKRYDSVELVNPNSIENNRTIVAGNSVSEDTVLNMNTVNQGGITTTSGAVDKSGQAQFGQSNWGESRGTVGESQWTVPPPVSTSFSRDFPSATNVTWNRNNDNTQYSVRYYAGTEWIISSYNSTGNRLDRRTEISLQQLPQTVDTYMRKQPPGFEAVYINRLQLQGKPEVYEIKTKFGNTIYVNMDGTDVRQ